jgi:protein-S-isoprenylcysteine O-methyltransferase Ste14
MTTSIIEYRPPRIALALLIIATVLHVLLPAQSSYQYSSIYLSGALVLLGFAVMMLAWLQFKERKVAICPTANTDSLITDGIYRLTRNPMYLGMVTMLGGVAVFFGTLPFYVVTIVYFVLIDRWFCMYEEEKLVATFGREYAAYKSKVRRWL